MSEIGIKDQRFGVEVEFTGITREDAAQALAGYFGTSARHMGGSYDKWVVKDTEGKDWALMSDASIKGERKTESGYRITENTAYHVEMVTPILTYPEIEKLQECVRQVRYAGAKVNASCGIHVHVDAFNHNRQSLKNLIGIMYSKENILFKALQVKESRVLRSNFIRSTGMDCVLPESGTERMALAMIAQLAKVGALEVLEDG